MQRPASHHVMSSKVRKRPRPERKGTVYMHAALLHVPAAMSNMGTTSSASATMKPTVWLWPKAHRTREPCHHASQRKGDVSTRIAGRQLAGKRSANDSNIESPSGGKGKGGERKGVLRGAGLLTGRRVTLRLRNGSSVRCAPYHPFLPGALDRVTFRVLFSAHVDTRHVLLLLLLRNPFAGPELERAHDRVID